MISRQPMRWKNVAALHRATNASHCSASRASNARTSGASAARCAGSTVASLCIGARFEEHAVDAVPFEIREKAREPRRHAPQVDVMPEPRLEADAFHARL